MRNSFLSYEIMSEGIDDELSINLEDEYSYYYKNNENKFGTDEWIDFGALVWNMSISHIAFVSDAYTRGDSLSWIDETFVQPAVKNLLRTCQEIEKQGRKGREFFWGGSGNNAYENKRMAITKGDALSIFTLIAWFLCFNVEKGKIATIVPFITPEGIDPLIDTMLKEYQPERTIGHNNIIEQSYSPVFERWHEIGNARGEEQVALIHAYLDDWAMLLSQRPKGKGELDGIQSIGLQLGRFVHKSNETLPKEVEGMKFPYYKGHWAWEVALFVKFFNIDDSSFRDNPLYPVEMVDYKK